VPITLHFTLSARFIFPATIPYSSHAQLIGRFNRDFVTTGSFPQDFTRIPARLFEVRQTGDHDVVDDVPNGRIPRVREFEVVEERLAQVLQEAAR
jgi:uncharacterized protein (UPF0332 family)